MGDCCRNYWFGHELRKNLLELAQRNNNRVILVGDPKQHTSIEAGDAFRAMIRYGELPVCRIQEIQRQKDPVYREAVFEWAQGNVKKALEHFEARQALIEIKDYRQLLDRAANDYVQSTLKGMQCLAISPVWSEINAFSQVVRQKLKDAGQLEKEEFQIDTVDSYTWTEAERRNVRNYSLGDAITFHRATQGFERHEVVKVLKRQNDFLLVQHPTGKPTLFNPNVQSAFDVGTIVQIAVARREKLLIQGNLLSSKLVNGESVEVKDFYSDGYLALADGRIIPSTFRQFTYGYANTSHTSQGKTVDRGILILGPDAIEVAGLRQGYVSNSRFQYTQAIYTTNLEAAKEALAMRKERKLAHDLKLREQGIVKTATQQSELNIKKEKRWHFGLKI